MYACHKFISLCYRKGFKVLIVTGNNENFVKYNVCQAIKKGSVMS